MDFSELSYAIALSKISGYNFRLLKEISLNFRLPSEIFSLSRSELTELFGAKEQFIEGILRGDALPDAEKEIEWAFSHGVKVLYIHDKAYPHRLRECCDAPLILYYKGSADLNSERIISIVGTRKSDIYGENQCKRIVEALCACNPKPIIVSGLAFGIDICAHRSALDHGAESIGVMGTGIDTVYPASHRSTAANMAQHGGILTDFPKGSHGLPANFIRRNRIIAGMCDALLLIQSQIKGGGMITASIASSYSKEIYALPGRVTERLSSGCNELIRRKSAGIITSPEGLVEDLGWGKTASEKKISKFKTILEDCDTIQRNILLTLSSDSGVSVETLMAKTGRDSDEILVALTELDIKGAIESDIYGNYSLCI